MITFILWLYEMTTGIINPIATDPIFKIVDITIAIVMTMLIVGLLGNNTKNDESSSKTES